MAEKALKIHLKLKGKALCGARPQKRKLKFASSVDGATCGNCLRAAKT
jgi:hypothetical protein